MRHAPENHWRIPTFEQRAPRPRGQVLKQITLGLVTVTDNGPGVDARPRSGFNPYDSRLGSAQSDVWSKRRRA
jgi:hypothetical protein